MKKSVKLLITAFSVCATSAFAVVTSGCDIKQTINELRCEHVLIDGEVTKEPTCTEDGEMLKECTLCTYTETAKVNKLGHTEIAITAVAPTCDKSGLTEGSKCGVCEEILVAQNVVPPKGHTVVKDVAVTPTCVEEGKTEGSHCGDCGKVFVAQEEIPMLEHVMQETEAYAATCEEKGFTGGTKCENCDYAETGEIIAALGHIYSEAVETTAPTCDTDGEKTSNCSQCGDVKVEVIPATGHNFEDGTCTVCGEEETSEFVKISGAWYCGVDDLGSLKSTSVNGSDGESLNFWSGGFKFTKFCSEIKELYFSNGTSSVTVFDVNTDSPIKGWQNEAYRYVIIEGEQNVSKRFYKWFTTYFEKSDEHVEFTIKGKPCVAESGMTWREWVESEYNVYGYEIYKDGEYTYIVRWLEYGGAVSPGCAGSECSCGLDNVIVDGEAYIEEPAIPG